MEFLIDVLFMITIMCGINVYLLLSSLSFLEKHNLLGIKQYLWGFLFLVVMIIGCIAVYYIDFNL